MITEEVEMRLYQSYTMNEIERFAGYEYEIELKSFDNGIGEDCVLLKGIQNSSQYVFAKSENYFKLVYVK
jgi:hypothetical protein